MRWVYVVLVADTIACLAWLGYAEYAESARIALNTLPDTTWQAWWKVWFVMTAVAWIGAFLLGAAARDARRS